MPLTDRQWRRLLTEIEDRQVLPVVGPEAVTVLVNDQPVALHHYLAGELARRLDVHNTLSDPFTIDDVVARYMAGPESDREDVYSAVRQILTGREWSSPEPLRKLAAIDPFDVFVSVTIDPLLERALDEVRFQGAPRTRSFAYTRLSQPADLPREYKPAYNTGESPPTEPAVYHVFGKLNPLRDYAVWEEDYLYFGHRLQSRDLRPENLFDVLRTRRLLLLGCEFPGWLTRFFLAAAKGDSLFSDPARGWVADSQTEHDPGLVLFLERRKTTVFTEGGAAAFIDELHRRWVESHPPAPPGPPDGTAPDPAPAAAFQRDAIFISYASEDRASAIAIRDALQAARLDVWFDQRSLEPGQEFRDQILSNIEQCSFFLPVISRNTANAGRRFFFAEWNKAVDEVQFRSPDTPFIVPVAIDDTPYDASHIPAEFRSRHWLRLEGALPDDFIALLRSRIRELRRGRR